MTSWGYGCGDDADQARQFAIRYKKLTGKYIKDINRSDKISLKDVVNISDLEQDIGRIEPVSSIIKRIKKEKEKIGNLKGKEAEALKQKIKIVEEQLGIINVINKQVATKERNPYYMPRQRYGDYFFTVVKKGKDKKVVHYETAQPLAFDTQEKQKRID